MDEFLKFNRRWIFFSTCSLCFFLSLGRPIFILAEVEESPPQQREEKLKGFRERKDRFFREDSRSPLKEADRKKFKGLVYYPIDLRYAMTGAIEKYSVEPKPIYVTLPTNKEGKKYVKYGRFKFKLDGKEYALQIYRPLAGDDLFLPFKDKTSGTETYEKGRYLYIEPMPGGGLLIDFNRAYNPSASTMKSTPVLLPRKRTGSTSSSGPGKGAFDDGCNTKNECDEKRRGP